MLTRVQNWTKCKNEGKASTSTFEVHSKKLRSSANLRLTTLLLTFYSEYHEAIASHARNTSKKLFDRSVVSLYVWICMSYFQPESPDLKDVMVHISLQEAADCPMPLC